jgi:hypothetical protein
MDAKLTLKLNREIIEKAKEYAASRKQSLSRLIESYLLSIIQKEQAQTVHEPEISPFVKSMSTGATIPEDLDSKEEYGKYREERYL